MPKYNRHLDWHNARKGYMTKRNAEISVKSIYTGNRSIEQAFISLIRQKMAEQLENAARKAYTKGVVYPDVHAQRKGETQ
jgi:hypothetical protein